MIHMLSRFDLDPDVPLDAFRANFTKLVESFRKIDLVVSADPVGTRLGDTPMDTDADNAPRYYVVMRFRDRAQLDAAYAYLSGGMAAADHMRTHLAIHRGTTNQVFTCWEDDG